MQQTTPFPAQAYLIIQLGNRWTDVLRLTPEQSVLVGRASENQVIVRDERVSRHHAKIHHQPEGWVVEDLGSRNGTQVNGETIPAAIQLADGHVIGVGGCRMTFTHRLADAFPSGPIDRAGGGQATVDAESASIVNRLKSSQWSTELDSSILANPKSNSWSFFYRLVFDLVQCESEEAAATVALDKLLQELGIDSGGVILLETSNSISGKTPSELRLAVLAARQAAGRTYHRVSDFLVDTVVREQQALLARNIQDDENLSVARHSGQREICSSLCAPLKIENDGTATVIGLVHLYTQSNERTLSGEDLDLAVGVADNLALALSRLRGNQQLATDLIASRRKVDQLEQQLQESSELIGGSPPMTKVKQFIQRAGPSNATVLVRGESGVGKELVARAIHFSSSRRSGPLVCLNCAALAPSLLESELFGHEKGSFTGATERKIGKFEAANNGTLFLDEVGEMPVELQAKFLRVLEGHPFERLGGNSAITTNVRVIAATNRDLESAVQEKAFRSDLYFRLRVVEITIPPLRERPDDIPALVEHFLTIFRQHACRRLAGMEPKAMEALVRHAWPGNVRELRNVIERAVVLGMHSTVSLEDLSLPAIPADLRASPAGDQVGDFIPRSLDEMERSHILAMLEYVEGNKSKAAQLLGIERSTLDRKLKRFS